MKAAIKEAQENKRNLKVQFSGYGHWIISCDYRGKRIKKITTDSRAVDNFNSDWDEKGTGTFDKGCNLRKNGYEALCNELISSHINRMK